jgi:hypothetical protein
VVGAGQHPAADFGGGQIGDHVNRDAAAIGEREFRGRAAAGACGVGPGEMADDVIGFVFDQIEIEADDFADHSAKALHVGGLPFAEMRGFFVSEIFLLVLGGIVHAMAQLLAKERGELAAPQFTAVGGELDGTAEVCEHEPPRQWPGRRIRKLERPRGLEPPPTAWQAVVLPLYYGRSEQPIYSMGVRKRQDHAIRGRSATPTSALERACSRY